MGVAFPWGPPGEAFTQLPRALLCHGVSLSGIHASPSIFQSTHNNGSLRLTARRKTGEGDVVVVAASALLEVDGEGNIYINVGNEGNEGSQEGSKESEGDKEGDLLKVVAAWL